MDAYLGGTADLTYSDEPPILLAASGREAMALGRRTIEATSFRIGAQLPVDAALERLELQGRTKAVWIEIDRDCGGPMDALLRRISRDVMEGRYAAVVSTTSDLIDPLAAMIDESSVEIVVNGTDSERIAALSVATSRLLPARVGDVASDRGAERLRQLSEEVSRIASTLARLSAGPGAPRTSSETVPAEDIPPLSADTVANLIRARRLRGRFFPEELFADPAWDMLLDLLQAEIRQHRVPVSSLCIAAAVPATTALRWVKTLVGQGLFVRRADPHDGRRVFVELAPDTSLAMRRYFGEVGPILAI